MDVWRQFDGRDDAGIVLPDEFRRTDDRLFGRTAAQVVAGMVLMSPCYVQTQRADPMRARIDEYVAIARESAAKHGVIFVDVQAAIDSAPEKEGHTSLAPGRVHPTPEGHAILADAFLAVVS